MEHRDKEKTCIQLLRGRAAELDRLPRRKDFSDEWVCQIKNVLGPWPRALEAAGLKKPREAEQTNGRD